MKKLILLSVLAGALFGCGGTGSNEQEYNELVARAENEIMLAAKTGFLWLNTESLLREAKTAQAAGDTNKAMTLAKKALDEAVLAQQQARSNASPKADFGFKQ